MNIGGLALAYWIEYFMYLNPNKVMAWRTPLALQIVFIFIIGIGINFFPERYGYHAIFIEDNAKCS